jgi:hypothetical protein
MWNICVLTCLALPASGLRLRLPFRGRSNLKQDIYSRDELSEGIAGFYDRSSGLWESSKIPLLPPPRRYSVGRVISNDTFIPALYPTLQCGVSICIMATTR